MEVTVLVRRENVSGRKWWQREWDQEPLWGLKTRQLEAGLLLENECRWSHRNEDEWC